MESSVVTVKGQIVIPAKIRRQIGLKKGSRVYLEEKQGNIIVYPATAEFYDRTFGVLKGSGLVRALEKSRRKEKAREEAKI